MIDTHAHILSEYYDDIDKTVKLLKDKNVLYVLNAASNIKEAKEIIDLSKKYNNYWIKENKEEQKELFIKQIKLANKYNLPVVVHSRDAIQDTFDILKEYKTKGVLHSFSGSIEMAREFIKLGYKLGIGGVLTFKKSKLYEVIEKIDLDSIVLETDSPYLTPEPFRGKKNNPSNVYYVAKKIAEIKGISIEKVLEITTKNAIQLFDI